MTGVHDDRKDRSGGAVAGPVGPACEPRTLDGLLAESGPLELKLALAVLRPLAREIDRLHARGTIHGAVRPWHVIVVGDPAASGTNVEAGFSKGSDAVPAGWALVSTRDGRPADVTTPDAELDAAYRSPQLLSGEDARPLDDLYALGVVAYEMLAGRLPFEQGTLGSPARRAAPPGESGAGLPDGVERVLLAQVSASPASRFATGQHFIRELERAAEPNLRSDRATSIAELMSPPTALPTMRRVSAGLAARQLALAELPDVARTPRHRARPRHVRRTDYPNFGLPGRWVAVIVAVLCSVYMLPGYYMLRRLLGGLWPDLFGPG